MTDTNYPELRMHRLRKMEVVVLAEDQPAVETLLKSAGLTGWTIIRDVAGMGHHGFHQGKTIFNDSTGLVMFVGVGQDKLVTDVARGLSRFFQERPGVSFFSDVEVMRSEYFAAATDEKQPV